jgi:formylglycine-generating enzyme required for sulfatase activity
MSYLEKAQGTFINLPPPGASNTFMMGSTQFGNTQPVRQITLTPFAMQETPVTVEQFCAHIENASKLGQHFGLFVYGRTGYISRILWSSREAFVTKETLERFGVALDVGETFSQISQIVPTMDEFKGRFECFKTAARIFLKPDHPVVFVNWYEAAAFAFSINGRLPTEAEWEFAARAGRNGDNVYGTDTGELTTENAHWHREGKYYLTAPVKSHPPNPWGLYDMAGNVGQWMQGWLPSSSSLKVFSARDPVGPLEGKYRAVRCDVRYNPHDVRLQAAFRSSHPPHEHYDSCIGFRVVRSQNSPR